MTIDYSTEPNSFFSVDSESDPVSIDTDSDEITVLASAGDNDGGVKKVEIWYSATVYRNGTQITYDTGAPIEEYVSSAMQGEEASTTGFASYTFDLQELFGATSGVDLEIWAAAENFDGMRTLTTLVEFVYRD